MRTPEERYFPTSDGTRLFYRYWPQVSGPVSRAVVLFHRGHEHSGRLQHIVDELDMPSAAMFAWDARGHGRSAEPAAGPASGNSPGMGTLIRDVDEFVRHISGEFGFAPGDIAVVGQSVGAVLVAAWVHDYAPPIRCMSLASPAFSVKLYVPLARTALGLFHRMFGNFHVNSYVKPGALTHDPDRIASYAADPLIRRPIAANILLALYSTAGRVIEDAQAIRTPTQVLISGADFVVRLQPQHRFFERLGSAVKEKHVFAGFYHDTLGERDRGPAIARVREFLERRLPPPDSLVDADRAGYTKDEFDRLSRPLPALSPKAMAFGLTRLGMRTGGRLSDGIRLGLETGFDSGSTLDYVYRNQAAGITPLGRLIDRFYLNAIGWRGIRIRKRHLERLLRQAMASLGAAGRPVRIADIAAGHGRYVLEAIEAQAEKPERILLRDFSEINVRQGERLIREKGLEAVAHFEMGDAFDRASVAAIAPRPTVGIVSGLYELFPRNAPLRESLAGLAEAIEPGGYLIYTGQPWHPQLETIARTLPSHRAGKPWIMRRRTQAEMDQLVAAAGFRKTDELADDWGIFTVSLAQRTGV